jgi:hypothetical protein
MADTTLRALLFTAICFSALASIAADQRSIYLKDNSDWWSALSPAFDLDKINGRSRPLDPKNFEIAGIVVGDARIEDIVAKLGQAIIVKRGDASTGRSQVCYVSREDARTVHLIFEQGEVDQSFRLFESTRDWNGSNYCEPSKLVTSSLSTLSGLRLGLSRAEVEAVLGKPEAENGDEVIYVSETKEQVSSQTFDVSEIIEAKFMNSKLYCLGVWKTETD